MENIAILNHSLSMRSRISQKNPTSGTCNFYVAEYRAGIRGWFDTLLCCCTGRVNNCRWGNFRTPAFFALRKCELGIHAHGICVSY